MLLCAGNLLAPIAVAVAEEGMLEVWMRRREAQKREKLRVARKQVEAARRGVCGASAALAMLHMGCLCEQSKKHSTLSFQWVFKLWAQTAARMQCP